MLPTANLLSEDQQNAYMQEKKKPDSKLTANLNEIRSVGEITDTLK